MSTAWFQRGDGARFEVPADSEAYALLVAQGAMRIPGPDAPSPTADDDAPAPTKAQLLERADELDLEVRARATNAEISEAIAAEEQRLADEAAASTADDEDGSEGS